MSSTQLHYFLLSEVNLRVKLKIGALKGFSLPDEISRLSAMTPDNPITSRDAELYVTAQIYSNGVPVSVGVSTTYKCFPTSDIKFKEWLTFPVKYRDLSPTSRLVLTVYNVASGRPTAVGGTTLPMFNKKGVLKLGRRRLALWPGVQGDGAVSTTTPYRSRDVKRSSDKLEHILHSFDQKAMPHVKWLDKLVMKRIEKLNKEAPQPVAATEQDGMHLTVEFPAFKHPVIYHQKLCNPTLPDILPYKEKDRLFVLHDPEIRKDNPVEHKFNKLEKKRDRRDRDAKPKVLERKEIANIVASPDKRLTYEQRQLLWKFRWALTENKRALTKFLRCVDWNDDAETTEALELVNNWTAIDIADALELLSSYFRNEEVRVYAVKQLKGRDDEELGSCLLQLVQALRYEPNYPSYLSEFLIGRAVQSFAIANSLYWYLAVEAYDRKDGTVFSRLQTDFLDVLTKTAEGIEWEKKLKAEGQLIRKLIEVGDNARSAKGKGDKKIERLRQLLSPDGEYKSFRNFEAPAPVAVRPDVLVTGLVGDDCTLFTSKLYPLLASFNTPSGGTFKVMFKSGDDLRQDQLIIQMINLMDALLKKVKLDLQLTPYRVLATGPEHGMVEYVPNSHTLTSILKNFEKDIRKFFIKYHPKPQSLAQCLDTFVKSTAGYCVITYILGIGDRHLDNVLLTTDGHLFHIDFGYSFGRDPKPYPPPMKFCKEMVEAMGGSNSPHYQQFRKYVALAFHYLRQHAPLILNLLSLMSDANIPDLSADAERNLLQVQEKFRLDLSDEQADHFINALIDESVSALFPQIVEKIHQWALYWKNSKPENPFAFSAAAEPRRDKRRDKDVERESADLPDAI